MSQVRVTAILYSQLATRLRSLAIILPDTHIYYHSSPRLQPYTYNYHTYAYKAERWRTCPYNGAGSVVLTLLAINDANTLIMCIHYQVAFVLPDIQDQKSLTLRWRSFSTWGRERVAFFLPYMGCQNFYYVYSLPKCVFITRLTGPKIVDTLLTLILKMGQGACCILLCI